MTVTNWLIVGFNRDNTWEPEIYEKSKIPTHTAHGSDTLWMWVG